MQRVKLFIGDIMSTTATPRAMPFADCSASTMAALSLHGSCLNNHISRQTKVIAKRKQHVLTGITWCVLRSGAKGNSLAGPNTWQCASIAPAGGLKSGVFGLGARSPAGGIIFVSHCFTCSLKIIPSKSLRVVRIMPARCISLPSHSSTHVVAPLGCSTAITFRSPCGILARSATGDPGNKAAWQH